MHRMIQTQEKKLKELVWEDASSRQVIPVYEEPPVIETEYYPYIPEPLTTGLPDVPRDEFREAVEVLTDNTAKALGWSVYVLVRVGALVALVAVHVLKALALVLKAVVGVLFSALTGPEREDVSWGPAEDYGTRGSGRSGGGGINININIKNNRLNG